MKITPDWKDSEGKGLEDIGWALKYEGMISSEGSIEIEIGEKWLIVTGSVQSREGIEAGGGIKAGLGIEAGWGIKAGLHIRCKTTLAFSFNLFAGTAVWKKTTEEDQLVECLELKGGEVRHGIIKMLKEA